jgi:hypothetical protein
MSPPSLSHAPARGERREDVGSFWIESVGIRSEPQFNYLANDQSIPALPIQIRRLHRTRRCGPYFWDEVCVRV